jgi:hypothetical protein
MKNPYLFATSASSVFPFFFALAVLLTVSLQTLSEDDKKVRQAQKPETPNQKQIEPKPKNPPQPKPGEVIPKTRF